MNSDVPPTRLRDQVRHVIRMRRYSRRTEKSYWLWIRQYIHFHGTRHPSTMGAKEVREFLTWLAVHRNVAASTQNQALNALVFLYDRVLEQPLGNIGEAVRARCPPRLPVVLQHDEAMAIIRELPMPYRMMASLMYGSGLRVVESTRIRVKDVDFSQRVVTVRNGKGGKDRTTVLPDAIYNPLRNHIATIRQCLQGEPVARRIPVTLPYALARKDPDAATSLAWQWLFPSSSVCRRTVQELLGHRDLRTTQIYTHVLGQGYAGVRSPLGQS